MADLQHKFVTTNGIRMHYVEQGSGPLVVLCHGWPESWYSYRHQIPALAAAGFRVVAPDQRGYGQTDRPEPIESYHILNLVGDIVGLVNSLGVDSAVIVGHDWGAPVAWNSALLRPDIFRAIGLLSVPYFPRTPVHPIEGMKALAGDQNFYQLYFQEPGKVEKELDADPRRSMAMILYSASGDPPPNEVWKHVFPKSMKFIDTGVVPKQLPPWLTEADLDFFANEFKRAGFRGGINWYRNFARNWELTPFLDGAKLRQPAVFAAGEHDVVGKMYPGAYDMAGAFTPNLKKKVIIPGAGHWIQQERPREVNDILIEFLKGL
ncbi:MAG: alpha/beta hydrolase [Candidatus Binatus sp.]|uniref:alpha/beta fold hydrolase n=1 Tax=Candidatus Binatus sp. TaxID=2811406 RepID=UPI0027265D50|nr:alpha/beta hydrolase [Candidatus Binatus sp.]MDO8431862.1 alpha/beta hydrolase [Candidatus Binatus sp.]